MTRKKKATSEGGRSSGRQKLSLSLDLNDASAFHDVLSRVVREAGGSGGLIATWDESHPGEGARTSSYNLDADIEASLAALLDGAPALRDGGVEAHVLGRLHDDPALRASLGSLEVMAIPIRLHDRSVGLLCLLHPSHAAGLLQKTPGVYSFRFDEVEVVVQGARLLQRLLAERKWLEAVVSQNSDGVAVIDAEGRVVGFNPAMARLSGWVLDDAVGKPAHDVFPLRLGRETVETGLARTDAGPRLPLGDTSRDARLQSRAGDWIEVEASTTALWDAQNRVLGWSLTVRDVRARKEKERLERIFLSGVSHELQTPIAVIKGFSGLISDAEAGLTLSQAREKAAIIHEESTRLERMVGQLLFATRLQAGGVTLVREPVAVGVLMARVARRLEPLARDRHAVIEVDAPSDAPLVSCDAEKIEQVIDNLVENALKYGRPEGEHVVGLRLEVRPEEIEISVYDHGPGVAPDERDRIFHVFERGRGAPRASGSGLGLFISKAIVEAHDGRIGLDTTPGGGARFCFTLPRDP